MNFVNASKTSSQNRYLLDLPCGYCLIDTGYKWAYADFLANLAKCGLRKDQIKFVIITHAHADHAGFLKELIEDVRPTVIYNPDQRKRLEAGKNDLDTYVSTFSALIVSKMMTAFVDKYHCFPAVKCDNFVPYYDNPLASYGVELIPLSGHTDADLAVKYGSNLFCGDIFMNGYFSSHRFPFWVLNKFRLVTAWETILTYKDIATVYPAHGKPFDVSLVKKDIEYWRNRGVFKLFKKK